MYLISGYFYMGIMFFLGPFHASEMAEWYKSGYFSLNLMLRRACDEKYVMLGDLVLHYGYVPFMSQMVHPPIKVCTGNILFYM